MRRAFTIVVVVAQVLALGWLTLDDKLLGPRAALRSVGRSPRGSATAQPREIRGRTACPDAAQSAPRLRIASPRGAITPIREARAVSCPAAPTAPDTSPQPPLILRI